MVKDDPTGLNGIHSKVNEGATMLSINERCANASKRADVAEHQQRVEQRKAHKEQKKITQRRCYIIGELVSKYFPEVEKFRPGTKDKNTVEFGPLEAFLSELAADRELMEGIRARAHRKCDGAGRQEQLALPQTSDV